MNKSENSSMIEGRYKEYQYELVDKSFSKPPAAFCTISTNHQNHSAVSHVVEYDNILSVKKNPGKNIVMAHEKGSQLLQFVAAIAANISIIAGGAMLGWTSSTLLKLEKSPVDEDNPLGVSISKDESSWIGSLISVGALIGSFLAAYLAEKFGRRITLLSSAVPFLISWILIATATAIEVLYAARLVGGLALAIPFTVLPMYCGEIAETSIRGILGSFLQLFITIGLIYAYAIGPYVSYTVFWIACAALPIIFFICFFKMPESPYFLAAQGRKNEMIDVLAKLRGKSTSAVKDEADEIQAVVEEAFSKEASIIDLFTVKTNFKALVFTCALVTFQQTTGINVVLFYSEIIFASAGNSGIDSSLETIIVGLVQLGASCVTPLVVDRLGRRLLLIASGVGTTLSLGALGLFFYLKDEAKTDVSNIGWLPIVSLMLFIATYSIGWGPLPWTVMGEMFASEVKSKASGITVFVCWTLAFLITKYFSAVTSNFGDFTAYWLFAVLCILSVLFTLFILPETKGKTLQEIQSELSRDYKFLVTIFKITLADEVCDKSKCKGPLKYYESVRCKPKFKSEDDCCAYSYDCSHLKNRSPQKCYADNHEYDVNQVIDNKYVGGRCDYRCVCAENNEGLANTACVISDFVAPALERPGCYHRGDAVCGSIEAICPEKPEDRPTCQVDGKTYLDGEVFVPASEPYKTCYCRPDYKGENIEPFCTGEEAPKNYCATELYHGADIYKKCAPVESDSHGTNCTTDFRCPSPEDSIIPTDLIDTTSNETCEYGNLILNKGDKLNHLRSIFGCISCICEVGPALTCKYLPTDQCKYQGV